jgi:hypothetical protein
VTLKDGLRPIVRAIRVNETVSTPAGRRKAWHLQRFLGHGLWLCCLLAVHSVGRTSDPLTTVLDFDAVDATHGRVVATRYLATYGITLSAVSPGTLVAIDNTRNIYDGRALIPGSSPNVLEQILVNDPVSFTLNFQDPLQAIQFTRPALLAGPTGIVFPAWQAQVLDARGKVLDQVEEALRGYYANTPAQTFTLKGEGIKALRFNSNNQHFAAFSAVVLDNLTLVRGR